VGVEPEHALRPMVRAASEATAM
jgi:hypothetical protein